MNVAAKKPFTPAPRMNVLKDQLKEQRFGLITKVKALREQRQALKGIKGSGKQWGELCAQIDEVQAKIDLLSKSLGLPVKDRKETMPGKQTTWAAVGKNGELLGVGDMKDLEGKILSEVSTPAGEISEWEKAVNTTIIVNENGNLSK